MAEAIVAMKSAFAQLSDATAVAPLRHHISTKKGTTLVMPAYLPESSALAVKVVSVFPENAQQGEPIIYGMVLALDSETGRPLALLEGQTLTAIRTGAGSGAATDLLARADASVVAIIGSGVQARTQLEAVCAVRNIREVRVYSPTIAHAEIFAREMAGTYGIPDNVRVVESSATAVADADIVCPATTSSTPVFDGNLLKAGAHVNAVGAYLPSMQEVDVVTIQRSLVVVDQTEAVLAEAGDLVIPLQEGDIDQSYIHAELGEIVNGQKSGRTHPDQITYFKSVGNAVQDAAATAVALQNAIAQDLGTIVPF